VPGAARAGVDGLASPSALERELSAEPKPVTCEGMVAGDEEWILAAGRPARRRIWLEVVRIKGREGWVCRQGKVLAHLPARGPAVAYGDRVRCHGLIRKGAVLSFPQKRESVRESDPRPVPSQKIRPVPPGKTRLIKRLMLASFFTKGDNLTFQNLLATAILILLRFSQSSS